MTNRKKERLQKERDDITQRALELLRSPDLFTRFLDATERNGLVGEERNALAVGITAVSRLLDRPMNSLIKGHSSAGKNHMANCVLGLFPKDAVRDLTSTSEAAWNYAGDYFKHRVLYLKERNKESGAIHPARLFQSEGRLCRTVTVKDKNGWKMKTFEAEGPVASISTTTRNQLEIDDESRNVSLWIDESRQQTRRITSASSCEPTPLSSKELGLWREAFQLLDNRAASIVLPDWFADIGSRVYDGDIRVRRYFPGFVTICKAVALFRSFQKSKDLRLQQHGNIVVDFEDFATSEIIFEPIFIRSLHSGDDNALATRFVVEKISRRNGGSGVDGNQLAEALAISKDQAYARLRAAADQGAVARSNKSAKANHKLYLATKIPRFLPHPEQVFRKIAAVGDSFEFVHPINGERVFGRRTRSTN